MEALAGASFNLHHKLRAREVTAARPGASTHRSRRFYESIYPTKTVRASTQPRINPSDHPRVLPAPPRIVCPRATILPTRRGPRTA